MQAKEIIEELKKAGSESTKKILLKHGASEPLYGVKIEDLKKIRKKAKGAGQEVVNELYDTGIYDAMYLAGLMADGKQMTKKQLQQWVKSAKWTTISEYTVAWVASESPYGWELALEWIDSNDESIASAGWSTLSSMVSIVPDEELDTKMLKTLLKRVEKSIHTAANRVKYTMNGFVISVGGYVNELTDLAKTTAENIGLVMVDMGGTACKVPSAGDYIVKMEQRGNIGKKRKTAKC